MYYFQSTAETLGNICIKVFFFLEKRFLNLFCLPIFLNHLPSQAQVRSCILTHSPFSKPSLKADLPSNVLHAHLGLRRHFFWFTLQRERRSVCGWPLPFEHFKCLTRYSMDYSSTGKQSDLGQNRVSTRLQKEIQIPFFTSV